MDQVPDDVALRIRITAITFYRMRKARTGRLPRVIERLILVDFG